MSVSLAFSALSESIFSLLVFCVYNFSPNRFSNLACPSIMSNYINSMATHLKKWASNCLAYTQHSHGVTEIGGTVRYKHDTCSSEVECAVCLCRIENGDEIRELRCDHLFHRVCLDRWLGYKNLSCPLCRDSLAHPLRTITELGVEVLSFKLFSFTSAEDRETWWLR